MEEELEVQSSSIAFAILTISIVISILTFFFVIKPTWKDSTEKQKVIDNRLANLAILKDKEDKLKELSPKEKEIEETAKKVAAALPEHKDKARLFVELEGLASNSGLFLNSVNEGAPETTTETSSIVPSGVSELSYALGLVGRYENFKNFVINSGQALRILSINKINIKPKEGTEDLNISVNLSTFYGSGSEGE